MDELLVEKYLGQCESARRLDAKTVRAYRCDLRQYREWSVNVEDPCSREAVRACLEHLNGRYAPASVRRKMAAVRAFMAWAAEEGELERNPFDGLRLKVKEPKRLPRTIPMADFARLFRHLNSGGREGSADPFPLVRDRAIVETLIATGVRVSELCALDVGSVDMEGRALRVAGKGDKERVIQHEDAHTLGALTEHLSTRKNNNGHIRREPRYDGEPPASAAGLGVAMQSDPDAPDV